MGFSTRLLLISSLLFTWALACSGKNERGMNAEEKKELQRVGKLADSARKAFFQLVESGDSDLYMIKVGRYFRSTYHITEMGQGRSEPYTDTFIIRDVYKARNSQEKHTSYYFEVHLPRATTPTRQVFEFQKARQKLEQLFAEALEKGDINRPTGVYIGYQKDFVLDKDGNNTPTPLLRAMLLRSEVIIEGRHINRADPVLLPRGRKGVVSIILTDEGARKMERMTAAHQGWKMAIIADGWVLVAPVIQDRMGKYLQITMPGWAPFDADQTSSRKE